MAEKTNREILKYRGNEFSLTTLLSEIKSLTKTERQIVEARLSESSISGSKNESGGANVFLKKAVLICGYDLPPVDENDFIEELITFLIESKYGHLNFNELVLALRMNAAGMWVPAKNETIRVEFSGKYLNINFFALVFENYLSQRNILNRKIENHLDGV